MDLKFFKNSKYFNGFTLAEVLITLVIIGIIAAMTIPTLINNKNKQELVSGLKKANSTLQQALMSMARNNDASPGDYNFLNDNNFINEFAKVANVIKKCNNTADCFGSNLSTTNVYKKLNGGSLTVQNGKSAITADGQIFSYLNAGITKSALPNYGFTEEDSENSNGRIIVDINGHKGPNVLGRDLFYFIVVNGKGLVPSGTGNLNDCTKNGSGYTCATKILKENAMNY